MWWLYFKWQWIRDAYAERPGLQGAVAAFFLLLGLLGGWVHYKRDPHSFAFFGPLMLTLTLGLIFYLNFKYGASQAPELGGTVAREVRDRDYFYLWSFSAWSVWAALGLVYLWESVAVTLGHQSTQVGTQRFDLPTRRSWLLSAPLLAVAFIPMVANWSSASRAGEDDTSAFAIDMLNSVEPYGILVTVGDNDTFPLWYAQEVLGVRKDVVIANTSLLNTEWYVRQMIRRPIYEYDAAKGPKAYADRTWPKPTTPVLSMSLAQGTDLARTRLYEDIREPVLVTKDSIRAVIQPRILPLAEVLVLQMLIENDIRVVHFSRTSADLAESLGLGPYVVMQGHARRVVNRPVTASATVVPVPGEGYVDVLRSKQLWDEFKGPASLIRRGGWVDAPSRGIPFLLVSTGISTAEALNQIGLRADAERMIGTVRDIARAMRFDDIAASLEAQMPAPAASPDTAARPE